MLRYILGLFLCFSAFRGYTQVKDPVSWTAVSEKIGPLTFKVNLKAVIKKPYHIYPMKSSSGGLGMPTAIIFDANDCIEFLGGIEEKGVEAEGKRLAYYPDSVTFSQKIRLKSDNSQILKFKMKYMACNDRMCLPPASKTLSLVVNGENTLDQIDETLKMSEIAAAVEKPYQDFALPDTAGRLIYAKDIVQNATYTFIDFWASWCSPCRLQGRALIPLFEKYQSKGFRVIAVSLDTDAEKWAKAIRNDNYIWTNLSDLRGFDSPLAKYYNITAIPRNFLVDQEGNIIARDLHGESLTSKLVELLGR